MKRPAKPGELVLIHSTAETGDVQSFAVVAENYRPDILAMMADMTTTPIAGYLLDPGDDGFTVVRAADGARLTHNAISRDGQQIKLHTTLLPPMSADEAAMLSDLEQCAALMLLGVSTGK